MIFGSMGSVLMLSAMNSWTFLMLAGIFEICFTTAMKLSNGLTKPSYTALFVLLSICSFYCLNRSLATIPIGTAYAVWTGIGAFGTALIGILFFREPATLLRLFFLMNLVVSVIALKFVSPA